MNRIWIAVVVLCLAGCSGESSRLKALEKRIDELDEQTLVHRKELTVIGKIISRMQADSIADGEARNEELREKLRKANDEIRRLENN